MMSGEQRPLGTQRDIAREPRDSALAFTEGVRVGWITSDLQGWIEDHLLALGRLTIRKGHPLRVIEPGVGAAVLGGSLPGSQRTVGRTGASIPALVAAARDRVVKTLSASLQSGQTGYIHAALYAGRVSRERGADGRSSWYVFLTDDVALSDQVLALFAADALTSPSQYESELCVCDVCGAVSFMARSSSRRGCAIHPLGSVDGGKPPSSRSGARRIIERS